MLVHFRNQTRFPEKTRRPFSLFFFFFFFFNIYLFIYLFLAVLGLLCELGFCARAFSSCGEWGPLFITVHGPLTVAASLVAEHKLQTRKLSSCGSGAQLLRGMRDPPRPGLEPMSPALAGRLSTTAPPGKPPFSLFKSLFFFPLIFNFSFVNIEHTTQCRKPFYLGSMVT